MLTNEALRRALEAAAEPEYRAFSQKLLPPGTPLLGVRLPVIRKLARAQAAGDWQAYLDTAWDDSFEERMAQGMTLGLARASLAEKTPYILRFLPKIDNWSLCDSFCASLKAAKSESEATLALIDRCIASPEPYTARFAVVQLLMYYADAAHLDATLARLERVQAREDAAQVAVAWALSIAYKTDPARVLAFMEESRLPARTKRIACQKTLELTCVRDEADRDRLCGLRDVYRSGVRN